MPARPRGWRSHTTTHPDGRGHAILAHRPPTVPLVFRARGRTRPPAGTPAGVAAVRGDPGPRPPDRHQLDPSCRIEPGVPPVLHHRLGRRPAGRWRCGPAGSRGSQATSGWHEPTGVRHRRHADAPLRAAGARGGHPPQPAPRPGQYPVRLRARVGRAGALGRSPGLGRGRLAPGGPAVRPQEGSGRDRPGAPAAVPDQTGVGRRVGAGGEVVAGFSGQAVVGGGRRGLREGGSPQAVDRRGSRRGQPPAQGRGAVDRAPRPAGQAGPPPEARGATHRVGESGGAEAGMDRGDVRGVREADREDVQDVPGDVASGRRCDPGRAGRRTDRVAGVLRHRPGGRGRRHPGPGGRSVQPGDGVPRREGGGGSGSAAGASRAGQLRLTCHKNL